MILAQSIIQKNLFLRITTKSESTQSSLKLIRLNEFTFWYCWKQSILLTSLRRFISETSAIQSKSQKRCKKELYIFSIFSRRSPNFPLSFHLYQESLESFYLKIVPLEFQNLLKLDIQKETSEIKMIYYWISCLYYFH